MNTVILNSQMKKTFVPKLRFQEFNTEWSFHKLGDFIKNRKLIASSEVPLYSLTIENGIVPKSKRYERSFLVKGEENAYKLMLPDDFAYNPMNLRFGALAKYKGKINVAVSKYYDIFYCNNLCDSIYLEYYLTSYNMIQYYNRMSTGTLEEKKRVHYLDFIHFKKLFPTLPEQQKIASFLSAVDEKIQQLSRKKELLEQYKKGVMQQLFSGKLRFKDENGKDYPNWEEKKLGEVAKFSKGKGISKSEVSEDGINECIRYGELYTRYGEVIQNVFSKTNFDINKAVVSQANDVIIPASGETQIDIATASCVMKSGVILGGDLNIIRTKNNGVFLSYYLNSARKLEIANLAQGISVVHLYSSQLALLNLSIPTLEEQQKIADFLSNIDVKIESVNQQITQTQTFKKGLLQQMFV